LGRQEDEDASPHPFCTACLRNKRRETRQDTQTYANPNTDLHFCFLQDVWELGTAVLYY
jgi:hypothetical protein